jgi:hypothetical protein
MIWEELQRRIGGRGTPDGVRVSHGKQQFLCTIGAGLVASLGWKKGDRVRLLFGRDGGTTKLRILNDRAGGYTLSAGSKSSGLLKVQRSGLPGVEKQIRPAQQAAFERVENGVEITLPAWARGRVSGDTVVGAVGIPTAQAPARPPQRQPTPEAPVKRALPPSGHIAAPTRDQLMGKR